MSAALVNFARQFLTNGSRRRSQLLRADFYLRIAETIARQQFLALRLEHLQTAF
jgi:hypothetical protein